MAAALLALLLAAPPELRLERGVAPEAGALLGAGWAEAERLAAAEGLAPPVAPRSLRVVEQPLPAGQAAQSRPGLIGIRPGLELVRPSAPGPAALRHEAAHQFLLEACPAAAGDRLFHEAFALAASGELPAWARAEEGEYLPLARALETLRRARDLDGAGVRRALARLLAEVPAPPGRLPPALARRLGACDAGARWTPLRPEELAQDQAPSADALVVLSRHSGEVLLAQGAASLPLPFGSTLKPFLLAGAAGPPPRLAPDPARVEWRCGDGLGAALDAAGHLDADQALLRSCNGWFLDWAASDPGVAGLGRWGPVLTALGLSAIPADAAEAIGVRPSLRLSPLGLAQAYRLLAEARPDLIDVLSRNAAEGTLAGVEAAAPLRGVALKTGTVLDAAASPRQGWIVAVDRDVVVVMARAGRTPRTFAGELAAAVREARAPAREAARVQLFGLVGAASVRGRCAGVGVALQPGGPVVLPAEEVALLERARGGPLLCAGGPWQIRLPGGAPPRPYAGLLRYDPAPEPADPAPEATPRERRARRGSDLVLTTTRLAYAAGVVAAEDAALRGEPRIALARVADANGAHPRHPGRPCCDTTHCQAFLGTAAPAREDRAALQAPLRVERWLPFSRGGAERWRAVRPLAAVRRVLGEGARDLRFAGGQVSFAASASDGDHRWEERRTIPCERLRGPLKLPACPERAAVEGEAIVFTGRGQGHGEGLDVEWARRSGRTAAEILAEAYGGDAGGR